jgi:ribosomal protein L16 Arg81 hydroxylase
LHRTRPSHPGDEQRSPESSRNALARCVEPIDAAEFLADYWEQRPLAVPRGEEGRFDDLLSVADVERLVSSGGLRTPGLRLVKEGGTISEGQYARELSWRPKPFTGVVDPDRVAEAFADGSTIVLQALHHSWPALARFCRELELELGCGVQANSYYTPRRSQGFAVHHDTHDVFVLQVAGEKHWRVYEPLLELPLKRQRWSAALGKPGPAVLELTMRAGDTLYLPRGWLHDALTSETDSLHITVGVNVHTWVDAFRAALEECEDDVEFRRSVPPDGEPAVDLVERLAERLRGDEVRRRARTKFVATRRPILEGHLEEVRRLDTIEIGTPLERRPTVIADLDGTTLAFEGKQVELPAHAREELEAIVDSEWPFSAAELPGELDDEGRLVLVRRLIREGFLRRSAVDS